MENLKAMTDEVVVTHRHEDGDEPMAPAGDDRVDGLRLREYACGCGFGAAILSRIEDQTPGASRPFAFRRPGGLA